MRILIVDPDDLSAQCLSEKLERSGYRVHRVASGRAALRAAEHTEMVLLELGLPDLDGIDVCRVIRERFDVPLIAFSCRNTEVDRVLCLRAGADDCLSRPFGYRELAARIKAVARRRTARPNGPRLFRGRLRIDAAGRRVELDGRPVELTRKEFEVLHLLVSRPAAVVSRRELLAQVWAGEPVASGRTVDTHVSSLRAKLGHGSWIVTVRGVGYRLGDDAPGGPVR